MVNNSMILLFSHYLIPENFIYVIRRPLKIPNGMQENGGEQTVVFWLTDQDFDGALSYNVNVYTATQQQFHLPATNSIVWQAR